MYFWTQLEFVAIIKMYNISLIIKNTIHINIKRVKDNGWMDGCLICDGFIKFP